MIRILFEEQKISYIKCKLHILYSFWVCHDWVISFRWFFIISAVPGNVCSTSFDFSLLYKLIRNTLSLLSSPTRGWGIKPLKGDITDLDDVERIRHNRNVLANNTELKLTNSVFKYLVNDLSQVCAINFKIRAANNSIFFQLCFL